MVQMSEARELASESPEVGQLAVDTLRADPSVSVASIITTLKAAPESPPGWLALCNEDRLTGLISTSQLLTRDPGTPLSDIEQAAIARIQASESAESAVWTATMAGAEVVVVEDEAGVFQGIVPLSRFLPLLAHEHEEDIARLGGFLRGARTARTASEEAIHRRVLHRAPWLLIGLMGAVLAAQIVRSFEVQLEETVALAFFLPGIVYMADAVRTQTETLVIRGLSVGVSIHRILRLEVITGLLIGIVLSVGIFPLALIITGDETLSLAVALALLASSTCATIVAMSLPWIMDRFNVDPAFGSGPLATVIQDLISIVIYFAIAAALIS